MLCIGKAHAEIISIHASVRKRPPDCVSEGASLAISIHASVRKRPAGGFLVHPVDAISIHASVRKRPADMAKECLLFVQTAEKCSAFARNKGEWAGKIEISGGFSPVLECEPDGGNDERLWFAPRLRGIYGQVIAWLLAPLQRQVRASRGNE